MQDQPTAPELVAAVREFLQNEILPALGDQRLRFRTLVALNVLGIVERELPQEEALLRAEWVRLRTLDGVAPDSTHAPTSMAELRREVRDRMIALCERIRSGAADEGPWREEALAFVRRSVEEKLLVNNPKYLAKMTSELNGDGVNG